MTRNKVSTLGLWTPITYHHYLPEVDSQQQHGKICDYPSDGSAAISFESIHPDSPGYNIQKETPMSCACRKMVRTICCVPVHAQQAVMAVQIQYPGFRVGSKLHLVKDDILGLGYLSLPGASSIVIQYCYFARPLSRCQVTNISKNGYT